MNTLNIILIIAFYIFPFLIFKNILKEKTRYYVLISLGITFVVGTCGLYLVAEYILWSSCINQILWNVVKKNFSAHGGVLNA